MVKRQRIVAKNIEVARHIAVMTGVLNVKSGRWLTSVPLTRDGRRTYSFKFKGL